MFEVLEKEMVISVCMFACLLLSLFTRVFLGVLYQNMIRETDNMASTENKLLKQCKLKFANCFELSGGVPNVSVFVDKFINHLSLGHLSFGMLYHFSGQAMLLSVVFSGIGICRSIVKGRTLGDILPFYIVSFIGLYLYFSISTVVDIKSKRRTLKINLVDYLENHLSPRIDVTRQDMELLYGDAAFCEKPGKKSRNRTLPERQGERKKRRTVELMPISGGMRTEAASGETAALQAEKLAAGGTLPEAENPAAVTEEELEALLREFLSFS